MKKYLLPENGSFYKANLHCHTTVSDGSHTPEAVKEAYKAQGYSIIAYTDHDIMLDHDDLRDENFLPLMGYEMEITEPTPFPTDPFNAKRTCHICLIAKDRETAKQVCFHRSKYLFGNTKENLPFAKIDESQPDYNRVYSHAGINDMIARAKEGNFFVTYNHPKWSQEGYPEYSGYAGMDAMEMFNGGCLNNGFEDYNPEVYDTFLRQGKRIYCIGTDDNHGSKDESRRYWDFFRAFTMIKADKLEYGAVIDALENGNFYASEGPEINELYIEDGRIYIKCSEAAQISFATGKRKNGAVRAKDGQLLTEASFPVNHECEYFRLTVIDEKGRKATTNAYFADEVL